MSNSVETQQQMKQNQALLVALKEQALITDLQRKSAAAEEEIAALRKQHLILKNICEKEKEKNKELQTELTTLSQSLQHKDLQITELHKELKEAKEVPAQSAPLQAITPSIDHTEALTAAKQENQILSKSLAESQQHGKQLERVIQFLRERGEEAHLEVKQLREEFQATSDVSAKYHQLITTVKEKEQELLSAHQEIQQAQQKIKALEETSLLLRNLVDEKDQELKIAQQHLARKVKEGSMISAKNEEQHQRIIDLQRQLTMDQGKLSTLQHQFEIQLNNEKNLQNQFAERLAAADTQVSKWEEKYFQLHEKFQEVEQKYRSLKSLEEKNKQACLMLNHLIALLEPTKTLTEEPLKQPLPPTQNQVSDTVQSLFERPTQVVRHKKTLFD